MARCRGGVLYYQKNLIFRYFKYSLLYTRLLPATSNNLLTTLRKMCTDRFITYSAVAYFFSSTMRQNIFFNNIFIARPVPVTHIWNNCQIHFSIFIHCFQTKRILHIKVLRRHINHFIIRIQRPPNTRLKSDTGAVQLISLERLVVLFGSGLKL